MEEKIDMPPKDEELFGATEIYLDGEKISVSNPFGFGLDHSQELDDGCILEIDRSAIEYQCKIAEESIRELFNPKDEYILTCVEIDGLNYTFTDGRDSIRIGFREIDNEIAKIKIGTTYIFRETLRENE